MSEIDISTLPISKIRNELKNLGLYASGTKKELIERYKAYWEEKKQSSANVEKEQPITEETNLETNEQGNLVPEADPIEIPEEIGRFIVSFS